MKNVYLLIALSSPLCIFSQVGINTTQPKSTLHIVSDKPGALTIEDNSQGNGKILTSDENGTAFWKTPRETVFGTFPNPYKEFSSSGTNSYTYTNISLNVTPGKWIIYSGLKLDNNRTSILSGSDTKWIKGAISSSLGAIQNTTFSYLNTNINFGNSMYYPANLLSSSYTSVIIKGAQLIEVSEATPNITIYLFLENVGNNNWTFKTNAPENYFYAVPVN